MAFKRSAVRSRLSPPDQYNPNLLPIGDGFGFIVSVEDINDRFSVSMPATAKENPQLLSHPSSAIIPVNEKNLSLPDPEQLLIGRTTCEAEKKPL